MEREVQSDLFEQLNKAKNKRRFKPSFRKMFPYGFVTFRLSYEGAIFSLIVFLMLCVIMFSIGMERGKNSRSYVREEIKKDVKPVSIRPQMKNVQPNTVSVNKLKSSPAVAYNIPRASTVTQVRTPQEEAVKGNYTIQVLTYRDKSTAEKQVQKLTQNGHRPFVIFSRGFHQICIGRYTNRESAKIDLANLRRNYKDCFIRDIKSD
jgi:hypothetical protein